MKNIMRIIVAAFLVLIALALLLVAYELIISSGKVSEYKDEKGRVISGSLSEKIHVEINGADNGFFINSKDIDNPVLLFISSGPGTDDYFFNEKYTDMHLEDEFTVVYWDYRGMGIAFDSKIDPDSITGDVLTEDAHMVTQYLKDRFNKNKIYIMGFSGGTRIAVEVIKKYPEDYFAYIGMAQVVTDNTDRDTIMYNFMKDVFTERGDTKRLKKLESEVTKLDGGNYVAHNWYSFVYLLHDAGGGTTYKESEFIGIDIPIMLSHCYTFSEKINYIRGMKMYRRTKFERECADFDFRKTKNEFKIPVFFLSGEYDYNCPWPLVEEYCNVISAPMKGFYKIKNAAHSPLWENVPASHDVMLEIKEKTLYEK